MRRRRVLSIGLSWALAVSVGSPLALAWHQVREGLADGDAGQIPAATMKLPEVEALHVVRGKIISASTSFGEWLLYVPARLKKNPEILVVCHGVFDSTIETAQAAAMTYAERWRSAADAHGLILVVPVFDNWNFSSSNQGTTLGYGSHVGGGYRGLFGRGVGADDFVNSICLSLRRKFDSPLKILLYGHSAGAQFATRFAVKRNNLVGRVVVSAPGSLPFPGDAAWPFGAGELKNALYTWPFHDEQHPRMTFRADFRPVRSDWAKAAALPFVVVVGGNDTDDVADGRSAQQMGGNRVQRARSWVREMQIEAANADRVSRIRYVEVPGVGHSSRGLFQRCRDLLLEGIPRL